MEEKLNAIYIMVRQEELKPEDEGSYERPLAVQKEQCLRFLEEKAVVAADEKPEIYSSRRQLLTDVERDRIKRIVVLNLERLGNSKDEIEGILYELKMREVELLTVEG